MQWTPEALEPWTHRCDPLADAAVATVRPGSPQALLARVEAEARSRSGPCRELLGATSAPPDWVDPARVERGRRFAVERGTQLALVLMVGSLIEGYASPSLSAPLVQTGRLSRDAAQRLYETGQMVHNVRAPGALRPGAIGHRTLLQVRLLHAQVRLHLRRRGYLAPDRRPGLHQVDLAHTATGFSVKTWQHLGRLGIETTRSQQADLLHFWRLVHTWVGVAPALLPDDPAEAEAASAALDAWRYDPTHPHARPLTRSALGGIDRQPPFFLPVEALGELSRRCIGDSMGDALGVPRDLRWRKAVDLLVAANRASAATQRRVPGVPALRARLNVALFGRTLVSRLGPDPARRAFGGVAGEADGLGPVFVRRAAG